MFDTSVVAIVAVVRVTLLFPRSQKSRLYLRTSDTTHAVLLLKFHTVVLKIRAAIGEHQANSQKSPF